MRPTLYFNCTIEAYQEHLNQADADVTLQECIVKGAEDLKTKGYCVIPNVVEPALCDYAHNQFWDVLTKASEGRLTRPHSAEDLDDFKRTGNWPYNKHGILEHGEFTYLDFVHAIRTHPRVAVVFAALYGVRYEQLLVAPDRINYQMPAEWLKYSPFKSHWIKEPFQLTKEDASWLHVDQSFSCMKKLGLRCIQGQVLMEDATDPRDATFECVEGSHLQHDKPDSVIRNSLSGKTMCMRDWYMFSDEEKAKLESLGFFKDFKAVHAKKGDLILWDSRLAHQGGIAKADRQHPRATPKSRFVIYVCMQPRHTILHPHALSKKTALFNSLSSTSHWPLLSIRFSPPRTYGQPAPYFNFTRFIEKGNVNLPVIQHFYGLKPSTKFCYSHTIKPALLTFIPGTAIRFPMITGDME